MKHRTNLFENETFADKKKKIVFATPSPPQSKKEH